MPSHNHHHLRQAHQHWDKFVRDVENVANELNPFKDAGHILYAKSPETVFKTVFTTMSATFDGPIGGYSTVTKQADATQKPNSADDVTVASSKETPAPKPKPEVIDTTDGLPESLLPSESFNPKDDGSTLAVAETTPPAHPSQFLTASETSVSPSLTGTAALTSSTSSPDVSGSGNNSSATAGVVIGVLGGLLALFLLIFIIFRRRRKQQPPPDNEKLGSGPIAGGVTAPVAAASSGAATAPQLSLRPVTQFNPSFNERRSSKGVGLILANAGANKQAGTMRPSTANSNNPQNPFNDSARASSPVGNEPAAPQAEASNPFDSPEHIVGVAQTTKLPAGPDTTDTTGNGAVAVATSPATATGTATAAAAAAATTRTGALLARKESMRKPDTASSDFTVPIDAPSPTGTEYSMQSINSGQSPSPSMGAAAIAAAGGPPSTPVHRVQLDFKPSMDDELGIQAGHLVRILHEYDDGWALCIRLDRSQQGVVPRTCLSTRPVKPRPAGGPPGSSNGGPPVNRNSPPGPPRGPGPNYPPKYPPGAPYGRPESPMRPNGRPQSPAHIRPYSPAGARPMSPHTGRPASPASGPHMKPGPRVQSPGPRQQRPQSPNGMNRRHSPPGPSPMNPHNPPHGAPPQYRGPPGPPPQGPVDRRPVPGQAY